MTDAVRDAVEKTADTVRQLEVDLNPIRASEAATGEKLNPDYFVQKFAR